MTPDTAAPPELKTLSLEIDGEIGTLTLDRPDALNAMSPEMIGELVLIAPWLADSAPLRALIVTGAGRAFSAGGDVTWFRRGVEEEGVDLPAEVRRGADALHQAIVDFRRLPYPVIAAVNGPAAGAGFSLALQCDIRIASNDAFFACAYGRIGASPDGGMTYFLPRVVGPAKALELLLNDPNLNAQAALEAGLVSEVVEPDQLLERAHEKASKLAAKAPHYVRMCKRLIGQSLDNSLADHLQLERHGIADSMATEDLRNGVKAFFAGEEPTFEGRETHYIEAQSAPRRLSAAVEPKIRREVEPMRKLFVLAVVLVLAAFGVAACGGDDEPAPMSDGGEVEQDTPPTSELEVSAPADGSLEFDQDALETEPGTVTVHFHNPAPIAHDFCLEQDGNDLGCTDLVADGDTATEEFEVEQGEYTYYCSVAGHREAGMEGTLTVE